jgi:non-heme chloroperoxidase
VARAAPSPDSFARAFANAVPRAESDRLLAEHGIPSPVKPLFQAGLANVVPHSEAAGDTKATRGPLLMIAGGLDRTVPESSVRAAFRIQSRNPGTTELLVLPDRGHSLGADRGWREVAESSLAFLARHGIGTSSGVATS